MRSSLGIIVRSIALAAFILAIPAQAKEPKIKESAYYEFRGRTYDRNTIEHTFTLSWGKEKQAIAITSDTKIYRHGKGAKLENVKAGDAVLGVGQARSGKLIAIVVAFGDEGVEFPPHVKVPDSITLPRTSEG